MISAIVLSYAKTEVERRMTSECLRTLREASPNATNSPQEITVNLQVNP